MEGGDYVGGETDFGGWKVVEVGGKENTFAKYIQNRSQGRGTG